MISFDDVRITNTSTWFFVPGLLCGLMTKEMKKSNIPYVYHNWKQIPEEQKQISNTTEKSLKVMITRIHFVRMQ